jgi:hypothetical protein
MEEEKLVAKVNVPESKNRTLLIISACLAAVFLISTGVLAYSYFNKANDFKQISSQLDTVRRELNALKAAQPQATTTPTPTPSPTIPASLVENVSAAISSGNTAALEGYMANSVMVVYAATEYAGARTPAQAVADLNYLSSATDPWDFGLSAATIFSYKSGDYGQYFQGNIIVGKSANNYVVSFTINASNKISTVFIAGDAGLLL